MSTSPANVDDNRVLFTGNGVNVIDDLMNHMPPHYHCRKCPLIDINLLDALQKGNPHVIVVCLAQETRVSLRMLAILDKDPNLANLPIIAIGNQADCDLFKVQVLAANVQIFVRPLDRPRFFETLDSCIEFRSAELDRIEEIATRDREINSTTPPTAEQPAAVKAAVTTPSATVVPVTHEQEQQTILVVDDDINMLNAVKACLQDLYDVVVVPSGKLALKYLSRKHADMVLLDYMMPEQDGPEVLRLIRTESPSPDVPVVFLTGVSDKELVLRGLEYRPNGYLLKPVNRELLLEKVIEILLGLS